VTDKREHHTQTAIRVPDSWLERIDKLADRLSRPGVLVTRTAAMRDALYRGIEVMEAEGKKQR
jgi:predicted DNA-binding protein